MSDRVLQLVTGELQPKSATGFAIPNPADTSQDTRNAGDCPKYQKTQSIRRTRRYVDQLQSNKASIVSMLMGTEGYQYCYFLRTTTRTEVVLLKVNQPSLLILAFLIIMVIAKRILVTATYPSPPPSTSSRNDQTSSNRIDRYTVSEYSYSFSLSVHIGSTRLTDSCPT